MSNSKGSCCPRVLGVIHLGERCGVGQAHPVEHPGLDERPVAPARRLPGPLELRLEQAEPLEQAALLVLAPDDQVIITPPDGLANGDQVRIAKSAR